MNMLFDSQSYLASRFSFYSMQAQAETGIQFDKGAAEALVVRIQAEMKLIEEEIEPKLPPRKLKKSEESEYTIPAKPWKKDGSLSVVMLRWLDKHGAKIEERTDGSPATYFVWSDGRKFAIVAGFIIPIHMPMKLGEEVPMKEWFLSLGWRPVYWNTQKGPNGKPLRDKKGKEIKTSPKLHEKGKLCPNLDALEGPLVKQVLMWLKLRSRLSTLTNIDGERGWLNDPRLAYDGRLTAGSYGFTSTFRQKHAGVRNVPKAKDDVVYGKEFRQLFIARPGRVLVGWDASSLEDRIKAHYTHQFDGGEYAQKILAPGYDVHQEAADVWQIPRHTAKNGVYALAYNAGPAKLAETIKCSVHEATEYHRKYWELNDALVKLDNAVALWWETEGAKKWIKGIDGRLVPTRSRHSIVNTLIQSTGAILFDWALMYVDWKLGGMVGTDPLDGTPCYMYNGYVVKRVGYFHDEGLLECDPEIAEDVKRIAEQSVRAAGKRFKFNVPLESEAAIGNNWAELK